MGAKPRRASFDVGDRVRVKRGAALARLHPMLADAVGVVGSVVHGPAWRRLGSSPVERAADIAVHVKFMPPVNLVLLNVEAEQIEFAESSP